MPPTILRDSEAMKKLFEAILESPNGKRTLSRLARTCRAFCEPALSVLWRELDSLIPIIGLFPGHTLKKARKPGMGFANTPSEDDWTVVLQYSDRVRQITYNEGANNVPASILQVLEDSRPRTYILPRLREVHWKAQTSAGLDRCAMFLSPDLRVVNLEIGTKIPQLNAFLADMSSRTKLASFSFSSPTSLPDAFTELLGRQDMLEKIVLVAPGALSPEIGRWLASLPYLKNLQLDLTGRSAIAVEGFFDELRPRSGDSTPSSVGSTDSGVFSEDDVDFSEIRKSLLRLTEESLPSKGFFAPMRKLVLTGDVSNIAVFVKHITSSLTQLELIIEDPPQRADWYELSDMICDRFSDSLESLRITATGSSRFNDLVRSTSRAEPPTGRLSFEHLTYLPNLIRLEIDLPESVVFIASDIEYLANACPRLETAKLCPLARFPPATSAPKITLNSVAHLITKCPRLHTLAVVIDAHGTPEILSSRQTSSRSLLRLHVGHSWIDDGLQVATFLSHMTPRLESLKYFQEKNRPGFIEAHARKWQKVAEYLPHLQSIRVSEKELSLESHKPAPRETRDKSVEAIVSTADQSVHVFPSTADASVQFSPLRILVDQSVESKPTLLSASVDARPATLDIGVEALTTLVDQGVDASPPTASVAVEAKIDELGITKAVQAILTPTTFSQSPAHQHQHLKALLYIPSIFGFLSFAYRFFIHYPLSIPSRFLDTTMAVAHFQWRRPEISEPLKPTSSDSVPPASDVSLDALHATYDIPHDTHEHDDLTVPPPEVTVATWIQKQQESLKQTRNNNNATRHFTNVHSASWSYIMADNKKQERDFTVEVDALLPVAESVAKSGQLQDALDKIFALEKQTRNAADLASTTRLVKRALQHCYDARDLVLLNSSISTLSKKHGQLKAAVQAIVELSMSWLEEIKQKDGIENWLKLVETLRDVTEGKIFLETPRARVTLLLSHYHETLSTSSTATPAARKESLQTASDLLSDLQVETYSSMERREKTEFILEQMRLLIAVARQKDGKDTTGGGEAEWVKVRVGGRKVNEEFLKDKDNEDLKLKYYDLLIQHALHQSSYLDVAKYYYKVWETPSIKEDVDDKGRAALEHIVYYVVLAPHNNEQSDMLHHLFADTALAKLELHYNLVKCFTTRELMRWPGIETIYGEFLRKTPVFTVAKRWEDLHTRVIEHNIRVIAEYYTRITLPRLTALLDLTLKQTEETLARLVVSGTIWARIDRPAGVVNFRNKRTAEDVMNDWSSDMQKLLGLVEKTWMGMNAAQAAQSRVVNTT